MAARVKPSMRLTSMAVSSGIEDVGGVQGGLEFAADAAEMSLAGSSEWISARPTREKAANRPGVTHLPLASITVAPVGGAPVPTETMRPLWMTTVPFSMTPCVVLVTTLPPVMATWLRECGGAEREQARGEEELAGSFHVSFAGLAEFEVDHRLAVDVARGPM